MPPLVVSTVVAAPLIVRASAAAAPKLTAPPEVKVKPSSVTLSLNVAPPLSTSTSLLNVASPALAFCVILVGLAVPPIAPSKVIPPAPDSVSAFPPLIVPLTVSVLPLVFESSVPLPVPRVTLRLTFSVTSLVVDRSVPPASVRFVAGVPGAVPRLPSALIESTPPLMVVPPVYVLLALDSVSVPLPSLIRLPPVPLITPAMLFVVPPALCVSELPPRFIVLLIVILPPAGVPPSFVESRVELPARTTAPSAIVSPLDRTAPLIVVVLAVLVTPPSNRETSLPLPSVTPPVFENVTAFVTVFDDPCSATL